MYIFIADTEVGITPIKLRKFRPFWVFFNT
nr:MAG TPA: hypothetical protein [Caudoviricetes sp.]